MTSVNASNEQQEKKDEKLEDNNVEETSQASDENEVSTSPNFDENSEVGDEKTTVDDEQIKNLKDQLLRAMAETENIRRRSQREKEETSKYAITGFARDLLAVSDNLRRALESIPEESRQDNKVIETLVTGVEMTEKMLLDVFEKNNIKKIDPLNKPFDHNFHQAMVEIPSKDHEPGTVIQVMQSGYVISDRLLRPAMVGVAKKEENK